MPLDGQTRRNRGFGFVRYLHERDQTSALRDCKKNGMRISGRDVRVEIATSEPRLKGQHDARAGKGANGFVDRRNGARRQTDYHGTRRDDRNSRDDRRNFDYP